MSAEEKQSITIKLDKNVLWRFLTFTFAGLFVASLLTGGFGFGKDSTPTSAFAAAAPAAAAAPSAPSPQPRAGTNAKDLEDNDPFLGKEDAPLTIIEFSDFQCPFCRRFWSNTLPQLKREYIDTGKVKFVYRDFPLTSIHPGAQPAAEAAECAEDQGKFWEYHDKIFEEQDKQGQGTAQFSNDDLRRWASEIGLDVNAFNDCFDSGKYRSEVQADLAAATAAGGRGTPYFVVGTSPLSGAQPFSAFRAVIEAQLAG